MSFPVPGFFAAKCAGKVYWEPPGAFFRSCHQKQDAPQAACNAYSYIPQNRIPSPAESRIIPMGDGALPFFRRQRACSPHSSRNTTMERRSGAMPALSAANPASVESAMLTAVARIIATTQGRTPPRTALTPAYFIKFCSTDATSRIMTKDGRKKTST